ncbi:uncharacterized protein LOC133624968 [Colius striatus]|uniref:uncharacterized protein LOC133624968 n=1 Tax=Colius striatus TaxID=57412 RepID=UPI002B1E78CF|nr:uncharacterized protein LOC133624968 [Colius striatus]
MAAPGANSRPQAARKPASRGERRGPLLCVSLSPSRGLRVPPAAAPTSPCTAANKNCRLLSRPSPQSAQRGRPGAAWLPAGRGAHPSTRAARKGRSVTRSAGSAPPSSGISARYRRAPGRRWGGGAALLRRRPLLQQVCAELQRGGPALARSAPEESARGLAAPPKQRSGGTGSTGAQRAVAAERVLKLNAARISHGGFIF